MLIFGNGKGSWQQPTGDIQVDVDISYIQVVQTTGKPVQTFVQTLVFYLGTGIPGRFVTPACMSTWGMDLALLGPQRPEMLGVHH